MSTRHPTARRERLERIRRREEQAEIREYKCGGPEARELTRELDAETEARIAGDGGEVEA
jgi:hypothetical protein